MENMDENKTINIEKRLKRKEFNYLDAAIACIVFIVLQIVFELIYGSLPSAFKQNFFVAFIANFLVEAIFFIAVIITANTRKVEFVSATKINKKPDILSVLIAVALSFICLFCFSSLTNVFVNILYKLGYSSSANLEVPNLFVYLIYVFLICICPAIFEDLLFRGCLLSGLRKLGDNKAVILSALIFMLMHGGPDQTIHQFIIGIVLGFAFVASNTIWVPIIIHFVNNFVALTAAYLTRNSAVVESSVPTWGQIFLEAAYAIILAIIGIYLVYLCINTLKKLKAKNDNKNREPKEQNDEVVAEIKEKTLTESIKNSDQEVKDKKYSKIFFGLAGAYLIINWFLALIAGFL